MTTNNKTETLANLKSSSTASQSNEVKRWQFIVVISILALCFISGNLLTLMITLKKVEVEAIKGIWAIFTPTIALAIGYFLRMGK